MKVDLSQEVIGFDGKPLVNKVEGVECKLPDGNVIRLKYGLKVKTPSGKEVELIDDRKPKTIGDLLLQLVTTPLKRDNDHTPEQRTRLFEMAQDFYKNKGKTATITAEDVVELKARAHTLYLDPQIFAAVTKAVDPGDK